MIYLDNAATTKPDEKNLIKSVDFYKENYFNPSALYREGIFAFNAIKTAKTDILNCLGLSADEYDVIFTSGGTESDNTAIFGVPKRGVFITDEGEHAAVYNSFKELTHNVDVVFCKLNKNGSVNTDDLFDKVAKYSPTFVSIMHVNNETGAINDVSYIADYVKKISKNTVFHSDGVQAFGKIPFVFSKNIDLYSVSAHKINSVKGVGALIKRKNLALKPVIFGGGQENGLRSGTENVLGIINFSLCARDKYDKINDNFSVISLIKQYFLNNLDKNLFKIISDEGSPYILMISTPNLRGETVMHCLEEKGVIVGNGSACSSKAKVSRVLTACNYDKNFAEGAIRLSFSPDTSLTDAENAVKIINETVFSLKRIMSK